MDSKRLFGVLSPLRVEISYSEKSFENFEEFCSELLLL